MDKNKEWRLTVKREGEWEDPIIRSTDFDYLANTGEEWLRLGLCQAFRVSPLDQYAFDVVGG